MRGGNNISFFSRIAITGFTLDDEIQLSTEGDAAGCCFKNVYCEVSVLYSTKSY